MSFLPFWDLNISVTLLSMQTYYIAARKLLDFIDNILICVPKMNEGLAGLERHEGE